MPTVDDLTALLAAPPRTPLDPDLFSGKRIKIARSDTLTTDVMGTVRLFEHKDEPLDELRTRFGVVPLRPGL